MVRAMRGCCVAHLEDPSRATIKIPQVVRDGNCRERGSGTAKEESEIPDLSLRFRYADRPQLNHHLKWLLPSSVS